MLSKEQISAASSVLDEVDVAMIISVIRVCDKYKGNPPYYQNLEAVVSAADGSVQAKQLKAALTAIEDIGIGMVEIDQRRVSSSSGMYYSQLVERNALAEYMLAVLYPEFFESSTVTTDNNGNIISGGNYLTGQREV